MGSDYFRRIEYKWIYKTSLATDIAECVVKLIVSVHFDLENGVPQISVLGVILFAVVLNKITYNV